MDKIGSYKIKLNDNMHMKEVLKLHQIASNCSSNIYLYREQMIADTKNLPKLLSFFLTTSADQTFSMIIDGENAEKDHKEITSFLERDTINVLYEADYHINEDESIVI
ncbi:HPr family phosphocarrier protein [Oceanobacillus massiliensis]|uniref:HPr family phosphocarrier protein n=1 Tax=Oceanobacillus massiliensis TaxID=1465765 RepID=UPI000288A7AD|nr:HPr family phosphocarrier protein [Oceanobacillus massiliensis]